MIIVLKQHAPDEKVKAFCDELQTMGYQINDSMGSDTHILGLIGDTKALSESWVLANPVVETCRRVSEPYKKANRKFHPDDTVVEVGDKKIKVGGGHFAVMAGPCSVESKEQITFVAQRVQAAGASILRGGAFKPRTSPYSFQGLRAEGLELLAHARSQTGQPIVTELMNSEHIPLFEETGVDMIQIGARNMQNFELLKAVGRTNIPVLLKRGLSATLEELVMSAEYIMAEGTPNVVSKTAISSSAKGDSVSSTATRITPLNKVSCTPEVFPLQATREIRHNSQKPIRIFITFLIFDLRF